MVNINSSNSNGDGDGNGTGNIKNQNKINNNKNHFFSPEQIYFWGNQLLYNGNPDKNNLWSCKCDEFCLTKKFNNQKN